MERLGVTQPLTRRDGTQRSAEGLTPREEELVCRDGYQGEAVTLEDAHAQAERLRPGTAGERGASRPDTAAAGDRGDSGPAAAAAA